MNAKNEIIKFDNDDFGTVRTILVDGEPWFCAKDVLLALGYSESHTKNISKAIAHVPEEWQSRYRIPTYTSDGVEQMRETAFLSEQGLYFFLGRSDKANAIPYQKWVAGEVIPSIRRSGMYAVPQTTDGKIQLLAQGHMELVEQIKKVKADVAVVQSDLESFKKELPVLPEDADRISNAVKKKGVQLLGGKDSPAYQDKSIRTRVYKDIYSVIKHNFDVNSYKCIKRLELSRALDVVARYELPVFLADMVENANAQQSLNLETGIAS